MGSCRGVRGGARRNRTADLLNAIRQTATGHLKEVPRAMIRLENAAPGSLGSTIVAARLPSRAHDAIDPADRRTGNEWARFESGRRNPTNERPACSEPPNSRLGAAPDQRLA